MSPHEEAGPTAEAVHVGGAYPQMEAVEAGGAEDLGEGAEYKGVVDGNGEFEVTEVAGALGVAEMARRAEIHRLGGTQCAVVETVRLRVLVRVEGDWVGDAFHRQLADLGDGKSGTRVRVRT